MGIYKTIPSEHHTSIKTIIDRIISNRESYIEIQNKKEQKLQNYYKNEDYTVKEVIVGDKTNKMN